MIILPHAAVDGSTRMGVSTSEPVGSIKRARRDNGPDTALKAGDASGRFAKDVNDTGSCDSSVPGSACQAAQSKWFTPMIDPAKQVEEALDALYSCLPALHEHGPDAESIIADLRTNPAEFLDSDVSELKAVAEKLVAFGHAAMRECSPHVAKEIAQREQCRADAERGDAESQFELGNMHAHGMLGVRQSFDIAAQCYMLAAEQEHVEAQHCLGACYEYGQGVEPDPCEAARLYGLAADQGSVLGCFALGRLNLEGKRPFTGVKRKARLSAAVELFTRAMDLEEGLDPLDDDLLGGAAHVPAVVSSCCISCAAVNVPGGNAMMACESCEVARFCSARCQRRAWKVHRRHCYAWKRAAQLPPSAQSTRTRAPSVRMRARARSPSFRWSEAQLGVYAASVDALFGRLVGLHDGAKWASLRLLTRLLETRGGDLPSDPKDCLELAAAVVVAQRMLDNSNATCYLLASARADQNVVHLRLTRLLDGVARQFAFCAAQIGHATFDLCLALGFQMHTACPRDLALCSLIPQLSDAQALALGLERFDVAVKQLVNVACCQPDCMHGGSEGTAAAIAEALGRAASNVAARTRSSSVSVTHVPHAIQEAAGRLAAVTTSADAVAADVPRPA